MRIGIFVCHCSLNVSATIDVEQVIREVTEYPGVVYVEAYEDLCLDPALERIKKSAAEKGLEAVVMTTCSPTTHQQCLRDAMTAVGLPPDYAQVVDIRYDHETMETATRKAIDLLKATVDDLWAKAPPATFSLSPIKRALIIGGGIAGIRAALDIADGGYEVILVEKTSSIGGHMIQLSETFPTLDCPQCIETPWMVDTGQHPNIKMLAYSEVEKVSGCIGNFRVKIRRKAAYVDWDKCNGCGMCMQKCLTSVPAEFDRYINFGQRKAIYKPFAQAVPNKVVIDREHCGHFTTGLCSVCEKICPNEAIDYSQQDSFMEVEVGAIVVATGYELLPKGEIREFEEDPDIIDGLQFERILCPSGPTDGVILRPSDGKVAKEVVFISCVGSRDPEHGLPYCSRVCCMYSVKMAMLYKHAVHDGQAYIFYMDIRVTGKGYEEFVQRAVEENGVLYLRGRVSKVFRDGDKIKVWGVDTLTGKRVEISCDLVVLATAMIPSPGAKELASKLGIATDEYGFMAEIHPKLRPLESAVPGIYLAGTATGPKDIPDAVAQASGAASKVLALFSKDELILEKVAAS
ncbi:MAG: CoB--CoM heterodisulfide reductase iron-sulfur subunit A family protein [Dehalococcoidia bacterium]|nr:MAG: CoB--CoM heterodisulfide reductase iron-sulfur subunit A family protein [Dehalococcoidia bacterium]